MKSLEAFNKALALINSPCLSKSRSGCCPPSQEDVDFTTRHRYLRSYQHFPAGGDGVNTQSLNQSNRVRLIFQSNFPSLEGDGLCSESVSQSKTSMLIKKRRLDILNQDYRLRPESLRNSQSFILSKIKKKFLSTYSNLKPFIMNQPPDTENGLNGNDPNSTLTNVSIDSQTILNSTAEQNGLLTFVENFPLNSQNFRRPSPRPPIRFRQLGQISRIDQIRQQNRTRKQAAKTLFVAARTNSRKEGHAQLLEAMRRCLLSKFWKLTTTTKIGIFAVNGGKPILSKSKKDIVGLPGLFDANLLAQLTEDERFTGFWAI